MVLTLKYCFVNKKIVVCVAVAIVAAATVIGLNALGPSNEKDSLFEENVEALTDLEQDMQQAIWEVHRWPNGDFNCTRGGGDVCKYAKS